VIVRVFYESLDILTPESITVSDLGGGGRVLGVNISKLSEKTLTITDYSHFLYCY